MYLAAVRSFARRGLAAAAMTCATISLLPAAAAAAEVNGVLTANGAPVALPYVYVWVEKEGFYDPADPTWKILFVEREIAQRELGDPIWDAAWVEIGVTKTSEFEDQPELHVYSQSIKLAAEAAGNLSGGTYPQFELQGLGSEQISGRIYHSETQEFFDDTYSYDFTFSAALSDPDAPIGDPLPAGGGAPGAAYLKWVEVVHAGDIEALKAIVPPELGAQFDSVSPEEAREEMAFMKEFTPTDVVILGGSSDGEIAVLEIEGVVAGETVPAEITMTRMGDFWVNTNTEF